MSCKEIIFASGNQNKIEEVQAMLGEEYKVKGLKDIGVLDDIEESATTLEGNASIKSHFLYDRFKCDCFSDDTGLEVEVLNNAPGVYSARYAGEGKNSEENISLLLKNLNGEENRKARFRTVISLIENGKEHLFEGEVNGLIEQQRHGNKGFGYDSVFRPEGYDVTFAQMTLEQKNQLSHRARAVNKLVDFLKK